MLTRKEKPDWFALIDKVKAIREMEMGSGRELAKFLGVPDQRATEWICYRKEAKAQTTLGIQNWVKLKESQIIVTGKADLFRKTVKKFSKDG